MASDAHLQLNGIGILLKPVGENVKSATAAQTKAKRKEL
jgi:hypothetical protein